MHMKMIYLRMYSNINGKFQQCKNRSYFCTNLICRSTVWVFSNTNGSHQGTVSRTTPNCKYYQFSSVAQSCPTLCHPMNLTTPGLPVHHHLLKLTQTHVHRVGDTIQPSHPLSSPSPPAPNPSQHQSLFQWVNSSHEVAKVLQFQL